MEKVGDEARERRRRWRDSKKRRLPPLSHRVEDNSFKKPRNKMHCSPQMSTALRLVLT